MKQTITHYERELLAGMLKARRLSAQLEQTLHRALEAVLLIGDGDDAVGFGQAIDELVHRSPGHANYSIDHAVEELLYGLGVVVFDPLTEAPHVDQ